MSSNQKNQTGNQEGKQEKCISRRKMLQYSAGCVGAAAVISVGGSVKAFAEQAGVPQQGDVLVVAEGARKGQPVSLDDLKVGAAPLLVLPKDPKGAVRDTENSKILLFRTTPDKVAPSVKSSSVDGVVAYSALCTHLGCALTKPDETTNIDVAAWNPANTTVVCPCHDAAFDLTDGAKCIAGPGPRPLPYLPIKLQDNQFVVTDDFSAWVGDKNKQG